MNHYFYKLGLLLALWSQVQLASGQSQTLTAANPICNARSAPPTDKVTLTVDQPILFSSCFSL